MKKFWVRENFWLNIVTIIMTAFSIAAVRFYYWSDLENMRKNLYDFIWNDIYVSSAFRIFLNTSQKWYPILVFGIAVIAMLLFRDMKNEETKEWIASLPISKKEIMLHQWFRGMAAYTIPHLVYMAGIMILYMRNITWIRARYLVDLNWRALLSAEQPVQYIKLFLMIWLWASACYSIFFLLQVVCRNGILAAFVGFGVILTPFYTSTVFYQLNAVCNFGAAGEIIETFIRKWNHFFLNIIDYGYEDAQYLYGWKSDIPSTFDIAGYIVRPEQLVMIFVILLGGAALACLYLNRMSDQKQEGIFSVLWIRYLILAGFGFCIGIGIFTNLIYYQRMDSVWLFVTGSMIFTILFVPGMNRLLRKRGY